MCRSQWTHWFIRSYRFLFIMSKCKDCSVAWKTKLYIRRYRQKVCMNLTAEKRATHTRSVDTIKWFWLMPSEYINSMCKEHDGMDVWYSFLSSLKPTKSTISYSHTNKAVERVQRFHFHTNQFPNFCVWVAWKFSIDLLNARLSSFSPMFARRKVPKLMQNDCSPRHYKRILWKMCSYCSRINWESFLLVSGTFTRIIWIIQKFVGVIHCWLWKQYGEHSEGFYLEQNFVLQPQLLFDICGVLGGYQIWGQQNVIDANVNDVSYFCKCINF